jgi:hypothetical protein
MARSAFERQLTQHCPCASTCVLVHGSIPTFYHAARPVGGFSWLPLAGLPLREGGWRVGLIPAWLLLNLPASAHERASIAPSQLRIGNIVFDVGRSVRHHEPPWWSVWSDDEDQGMLFNEFQARFLS